MGHTHLILETEMGCSHLLSTMETASATDIDAIYSFYDLTPSFPKIECGIFLRHNASLFLWGEYGK